MGVLSNLRGFRGSTPSEQDDRLLTSNGSASVSSPKKKWTTFLPLFVVLIVIAEIAFLGNLDMAKNAALLVDSWVDSLFYESPPSIDSSSGVDSGWGRGGLLEGTLLEYAGKTGEELGIDRSCKEWLKREDAVAYSRDLEKDPVLVSGGEKVGSLS